MTTISGFYADARVSGMEDNFTVKRSSSKKRYFIILDLDGTIIDEKSGHILDGVQLILEELKSQQHHLCICSNNIMASSILSSLSLSHFFDMIVSIPSENFKISEILECWEYYRYANRTGKMKQRIKLTNMIFVDNDDEIRSEIQTIYGIKSYHSVDSLYVALQTGNLCCTVNNDHQSMNAIKKTYQTRVERLFRLPQYAPIKHALVLIGYDAKLANRCCGVRRMKFHLYDSCSAFKRTSSFTKVAFDEAVCFHHRLCKLCQYHYNE